MVSRRVGLTIAALTLVLGGPVVLSGCTQAPSPCTKAALPPKVVQDAVATNGFGLEVNVDQNGRTVSEVQAEERTDVVECDFVPGAQPYWAEEAETP